MNLSPTATAQAAALRDIQSALLMKSLEQEELQARQLVRQDLTSAWKAPALSMLMDGKSEGLTSLLEFVPSSIKEEESKTLETSLRDLAAPFATSSSVSGAVDEVVQRALQMLGSLDLHSVGI